MNRTWTDEELVVAVESSKSYTDVTRKLGISVGSGGAIINVKRGIERLGLDISHWQKKKEEVERQTYRTPTTKRCSTCKVFKPYQEFFAAHKAKDGYTSICKDCKREKQRVWTWAKSHGLTLEEYDQKLQEQHGLCAICKQEPGDRWNRLYVDHRHSDNLTRGLLCSSCNLGLGKFNDNADALEEAAAYLRRY